jgi:hypothetical protein
MNVLLQALSVILFFELEDKLHDTGGDITKKQTSHYFLFGSGTYLKTA